MRSQPKRQVNRRKFLALAGAAAAGVAGARPASNPGAFKILGVAASMRPGKTTATGVRTALEAAAGVDPRIQTDFVDLGGKDLWSGALGISSREGRPVKDYFQEILPKLQDPKLGGLIIGSPCYFRSLSAQCKLFLERCAVLRKPRLLLADKAVGVLAVGGFRNGGQELVISQIQTILLCHEVFLVGGKPRAHQGATLWNNYNDDITKDTFGMDTARKLGIRVAEAVLTLAGA